MTTGWHIPQGVNIAFSTRKGGASKAPYASLNLGLHVGDNKVDVMLNRASIEKSLSLPQSPAWLDQVHSIDVIEADNKNLHTADGSFTAVKQQVCAVMTADCLPVLLCDKQGKEVAAVHAGWRGLCDGIIEVALTKLTAENSQVIAYLGPAIGPTVFEVGSEVRDLFIALHSEASTFFKPSHSAGKYLADLQGLATLRLMLAGVDEIYQSNTCTYINDSDYFSYRRDGITGRMASFIWLT